jgi:two-component system OmpR family sensor kinase
VVVAAREIGGDLAEIEVSDAGPGIDPLQRERIFDRFYSRGVEGPRDRFGLGLSIVKEVIGALDGTVALDSEPGVGTTARIALPIAAERRVYV